MPKKQNNPKPPGKYEKALAAAFSGCFAKQGEPDIAMMTPGFFMRLMMELRDNGRMTSFNVGHDGEDGKGEGVNLYMPYTVNGGQVKSCTVKVHVDSLCKEPIRMGQRI